MKDTWAYMYWAAPAGRERGRSTLGRPWRTCPGSFGSMAGGTRQVWKGRLRVVADDDTQGWRCDGGRSLVSCFVIMLSSWANRGPCWHWLIFMNGNNYLWVMLALIVIKISYVWLNNSSLLYANLKTSSMFFFFQGRGSWLPWKWHREKGQAGKLSSFAFGKICDVTNCVCNYVIQQSHRPLEECVS